MFEFLSAYLETAVSPELKRVYLTACQTLVDHGVTDHVFALDQELAVADSLDSDTVLDSITGIVLPMYRDLLGEFGVVLTENVTLTQAADVFSALLQLENYDDPESVNQLCDGPDGPEAALADILQLTGALHSSEYLTLFSSVAPELLDKVAELTNQEPVDALPPAAMVEICRERLAKLASTAAAQVRPDLRIFAMVEDGLRLGLKRSEYVDSERPFLEALEPGALALELLGMILASKQAPDFVVQAAAQELELLHLDQHKLTAAHVAITKLYNQVQNA